MNRASDLEEIDFRDPAAIRFISTTYADESSIAPLADNEGELAILEEIECPTSASQSLGLPVRGGMTRMNY